MATVHAEVESTYDADEALDLPDLPRLLATVRAEHRALTGDGPWTVHGAEHRLVATYFDTDGLHLAAAGLTLRRRTGGDDAGWHLKVPAAAGARSEVRLPLSAGRGASRGGRGGGARVPRALRTMTYARTGGRPLVPVVRLETHRTTRRVQDPDGRVLLELADDRVTARRLLPDEADDAFGWREIEVEVVDGPAELLEALDPVLRDVGLRPAAVRSKLVRALGPGSVEAARAGAADGGAAGRWTGDASAGGVVMAGVAAHVEQIRAQDLPVRLDAEGSVHAMRVATRRLRSALRTFGPLLRRARTRPVARELRWLARVLGEARDAEVVRRRVGTAAHEEADRRGAPDGTADDVVRRLDDAWAAARTAVLAELDGERYRALLDALTDLLAQPPLRGRADRPAHRALPDLVARADAEVRSAVRAARRAADPAEREVLLHDARKAAKRARYAAEAVAPVCGDRASRYAAAMEGVQEAIGEHLDAVQTRDRLLEMAEQTSGPAAAFALGRLHALEEVRAERSLADVEAAWATAKRNRLRRWWR